MILSAFLKLDVAGFSTGIGSAVEGIKLIGRVSGEVGDKIKAAFDLGGSLSDLSAQTGESAGDLLVLKQAFEDTGVGGDALGQTLALMRRNIADLSGSTEKTELFQKMGLDIKSLMDMGAEDQLAAISTGIRSLSNPSQQSAASMEIFGRSGAKMLTFLKDDKALSTARASLGSLPDIMDRNANAFDAVSDRIGRFKMKSMGLWAGVAEGLTPLMDQMTVMFDGVDVAAFGRRIGEVLGTVVELFRENSIGDVLGASLDAGWTGFLNGAVRGVLELGKIITEGMTTPFALISAFFQTTIEGIMEQVGKIPGVGAAMGLEGFKASDPFDIFLERRKERQDASNLMDDYMDQLKPFTVSVSAKTAEMWAKAVEGFRNRLAGIQGEGGATGGGADGEGGMGIGKAGKGLVVNTDRLARIGGYMGSGSSSAAPKMETLTEKIAKNTKETNDLLEWATKLKTVPVWG